MQKWKSTSYSHFHWYNLAVLAAVFHRTPHPQIENQNKMTFVIINISGSKPIVPHWQMHVAHDEACHIQEAEKHYH